MALLDQRLERRDDVVPVEVEGGVHPFGREGAHPVREPLAVQHGFGAERAQVVVVVGPGRADDAQAEGDRDLHAEGAGTMRPPSG